MRSTTHDQDRGAVVTAVDPAPEHNRRLWASLLVFALAAATVLLGVTGALFTDQDAVNNSIATGTVTITATQDNPLPWSISGMAPGDTDGAVDVPVTNSGSLELRYAITSTETSATSPDLANQLDLWIWAESAEADVSLLGIENSTCDDNTPKDGVNVTTFLYEQLPLGTASATTNLVGNPATGADTGDRVLAAAASEVLCFYLELPSTTDSTYEGLSTSVTVTFDAEQTANNA